MQFVLVNLVCQGLLSWLLTRGGGEDVKNRTLWGKKENYSQGRCPNPKNEHHGPKEDQQRHKKRCYTSWNWYRRCLLECGRRAWRPIKKQVLAPLMKKRLSWVKKYKDWTVEQWRKVIFSDETHFEVQGYRSHFVRRSSEEPLRSGYIQQASKTPTKGHVLVLFHRFWTRDPSPNWRNDE